VLILAILVLGLAAGWVSNLLVGRGEKMSWAQLLAIGIAGSFMGGLLASLIFGDGFAIRPSGLIGSIVGATLVLLGSGPSRNDRNVNRCRKQMAPSGHTRRSCLTPATASHGAPWDANRDPRCCKSSGSLMSRPAATHGLRAPMAPTRQRAASASSVARRRTHRSAGRPAPPEAD